MKTQLSSRPLRSRRHGAVLIVALVVTTVLAAMVLVLGRTMRVELETAGNQQAVAQAQAIERGGEQYVLALLATDSSTVQDLTDEQFQVHLGNQGTGGFFHILRPNYDDEGLPLYGLVEEGSKININTARNTLLLNLLEDDDATAAIVAWRDPQGPGDSYYNTLPGNPYQAKMAPFENVEELLMVRGIDRVLMYGNGTAPPLGQRSNILSGGMSGPITDAQLARGFFDLLTVWSGTDREPTAVPWDQSPRVPLAQWQQAALAAGLDQSRINSIRQAVGGNPQNIFSLLAGMTSAELDQIADYIRAPNNALQRIEVNQAPPAVLYSLVNLNGITVDDISKLLATRQSQQPRVGSIAWVAEALGGRASSLARYITNRSYFYSADIHAFTDNGKGFKRVRIVVDATTTTPQIVYRRDITDRPDPMDADMLRSLRSGGGSSTGMGGSAFGGINR